MGRAKSAFGLMMLALGVVRRRLPPVPVAIATEWRAPGGFLHPVPVSARRTIHRLLSANSVTSCAVFFASPR